MSSSNVPKIIEAFSVPQSVSVTGMALF